jgi:hypothetical protein
MTHRIVNSARSLALLGAVSLGLRQARVVVREPEAVRSSAEPEDSFDAWMFDRPQTAVSSEAFMLDQEYGRVSGALAGLRAVLSSLKKMPLGSDADYMPMAAASISFDPALFDEIAAPLPVLTNVVAFDEDDLFIESSATLQKPSTAMDTFARVA